MSPIIFFRPVHFLELGVATMVRSAQSPLGESQPDGSGDVQPTLLEWAQALSYRSRDDEQEISVFEEKMGHLTHTKLLDIVSGARSSNSRIWALALPLDR